MRFTSEQALEKAILAHKTGELNKAERLYSAILKVYPNHPNANHNLGILKMSLNNYEKAVHLFEIAFEANRETEQYWYSYIDALIKVKRYDTARRLIEEARMQGFAAETITSFEFQLAARNPVKEAKHIENEKDFSNKYANLVKYYQAKRFSEAEKLALSLTEEFPESAYSWKALGNILMKSGRNSDSLIANQKAVELAPYDAEVHYNLGISFKTNGRVKEAETCFREALALKPNFLEAINFLGICLKDLGKLEESISFFKKAIVLKPDFAEAHNNLGNSFRVNGKLEEAIECYEEAILLRPNFIEAHENLKNSMREMGDFENAETQSKQVAALKEYLLETRNKKSQVEYKNVMIAAHNLAEKGFYEKAILCAQQDLPLDFSHTVHSLKANKALKEQNMQAWLDELNVILKKFGASEISIEKLSDNCVLENIKTSIPPSTEEGPLISVLMAVWNASETVKFAVFSILKQTWKNIELIIVDDCSDDGTWEIIKSLAANEPRMKVFRNKRNVGPYVCKNLALEKATGVWVTGQDSDDWSHPQRLERHMKRIEEHPDTCVSTTYMIRLKSNGMLSSINRISRFSPDGVLRKSSISAMFKSEFIKGKLGFWDTVRFGADSEMLERAKLAAGERFRDFKEIGMLCLDLDSSLTNDPENGVKGGTLSTTRALYRESWYKWLDSENYSKNLYLEFPQKERRYICAESMLVSESDILANIKAMNDKYESNFDSNSALNSRDPRKRISLLKKTAKASYDYQIEKISINNEYLLNSTSLSSRNHRKASQRIKKNSLKFDKISQSLKKNLRSKI